MKTVWKFPLMASERQVITMRTGARLLHADLQHGQAFVWAEVDTDAIEAEFVVGVFGTGHPLPEVKRHLGTFQMRGGDLVWHVYELPGTGLPRAGGTKP